MPPKPSSVPRAGGVGGADVEACPPMAAVCGRRPTRSDAVRHVFNLLEQEIRRLEESADAERAGKSKAGAAAGC